ncbi:peptidylprolyl isomerase [Friedmanniella endophytica]|uniref:peptidylprolyl isomerase n=1 Tax=Microlunatus kandeliicorticis TaxID=1759536 RepID=A0A7W3P6P1_9ACTN|nr:FKBP-type peptidyl-prolyl cis-trans isomerase [Microlunatus kandeliicorticis]MBA8795256.1 peptidylprolyl isomerase [Microlunatus kandeliicorticis]
MLFSASAPRTRAVTRLAVTTAVIGALGLLGACGKDQASTSSSASPSSTAAPSSASPSASATPSASPTPTIKPSTNLDKVEVTGAYGKTPKVTFKHPFAIDKTQTKVLSQGSGATVTDTANVSVNYVGIDGRTGKTFDSSFARGGTPITFPLAQVIQGFKKGLVGQKQGSRVLIAMTGADGYDSSGGNAQAGINVGDTLLFVVDITETTLNAPAGQTITPTRSDLPTVTGGTGTPTVTIPKTNPPSGLVVQPLIKGTGTKVKAGDTVTVRYTWLTWSNGKVIESNYGQAPQDAALTSQIQGWQKGLPGQTVGSRVLLVVPPSEGYPNGNASPEIAKNETLVFVVDILFTQAPQAQ